MVMKLRVRVLCTPVDGQRRDGRLGHGDKATEKVHLVILRWVLVQVGIEVGHLSVVPHTKKFLTPILKGYEQDRHP